MKTKEKIIEVLKRYLDSETVSNIMNELEQQPDKEMYEDKPSDEEIKAYLLNEYKPCYITDDKNPDAEGDVNECFRDCAFDAIMWFKLQHKPIKEKGKT